MVNLQGQALEECIRWLIVAKLPCLFEVHEKLECWWEAVDGFELLARVWYPPRMLFLARCKDDEMGFV